MPRALVQLCLAPLPVVLRTQQSFEHLPTKYIFISCFIHVVVVAFTRPSLGQTSVDRGQRLQILHLPLFLSTLYPSTTSHDAFLTHLDHLTSIPRHFILGSNERQSAILSGHEPIPLPTFLFPLFQHKFIPIMQRQQDKIRPSAVRGPCPQQPRAEAPKPLANPSSVFPPRPLPLDMRRNRKTVQGTQVSIHVRQH